jgi:hypothetical protein
MNSHELAFRIGVHAYPPEYRAARGDEIMATLMDSRGDGHVSPLREFVALVVDGSRRRLGLRPVSGVAAWRSGARLAAFLLAFLTTAVALLGVIQERRNPTIGGAGFSPRLDVASLALTPWFAMFAITAIGTLVALAFGARRVAMVFAVAGAVTQVFELAGGGSHYVVYDWTNASSLPREPLHWLIPSVLLPGLIAAGRISRRRAVAAVPLAAGLLVAAVAVAVESSHVWGGFVSLLPALAVFALVALAIAPFDPRPAIATIPLLVAAVPMTWTYVVADSTTPATYGTLLLAALPLVAALLAAVALRTTRDREPGTPASRV